jgi:WhiB family transcriptional regulator, redox-sensing transcriptional regulator
MTRKTLPRPLLDQWEWQDRASCRDTDPAVFFSPQNERGPARRRREEYAMSICRSCPVREPCAAFAATTRESFGVWGGQTESQRHPRAR